MNVKCNWILCGLLAVNITATAGKTAAASNNSLFGLEKPAWLTDLSLTLKESYDNNVYMSGVGQPFLPASLTTLKDRGSFITTVSPKIGVNFARFLNPNCGLDVLSFTYAPDFAVYHALPAEDYDAHRMITVVKGKTGHFSYNLDNTTTYVDASKYGPAYPDSLLNAWATINAYQRRESIIDKGKLTFQYDLDQWFLRPTACVAYYGMMTALLDPAAAGTPSGYQNYAPRYDVNGGADIGYHFCKDMAATIGYRYGHQEQDQFGFAKYSSTSDYQRILLGLEGKPVKWLDVQLLGGPDFRMYLPNSPTHITPINDLDTASYYGEASLTATLSPNDLLAFKYKQYLFVSCLGKIPYFDSSYGLTYHHSVNKKLSLDLGAKMLEADYTLGNIATCIRDDLDYVLTAGVRYNFTPHLAADLGYQADFGRNAEDGIAKSSTRAFDRDLISVDLQVTF
jgi:hypothetical protein